jgi:hypothetical protein
MDRYFDPRDIAFETEPGTTSGIGCLDGGGNGSDRPRRAVGVENKVLHRHQPIA